MKAGLALEDMWLSVKVAMTGSVATLWFALAIPGLDSLTCSLEHAAYLCA